MRSHLVRAALGLLLVAAGCGTTEGDEEPLVEPGPTCADGVTPGEPLEVPAETWTWVPIEGNRCRDGSATGIGVYARPGATRLVIYLEGGGACFNALSCLQNPASFGAEEFEGRTFAGLLAVDDERNPFADASVVYVPYCTGDVHGGSAENVSMSGPNTPDDQFFVGHDNVARALARLAPTFPEVETVVLSGVSAGGFGTFVNYAQVADTFCEQTVVMLNDSGAAIAEPNLAPCLQSRWREIWGLDETLPADCDGCFREDGGGIPNLPVYLAQRYPEGRFGLISSIRDQTISTFFSFGLDECATLFGGAPDTQRGMDVFEEGLFTFRDETLSQLPNFSTYFIDSTQHTWVQQESFFETTVGDETLVTWVERLAVGPTPEPVEP